MEKEQLALYGGTPVRQEKIYYGHQQITEEDIEAVAAALRAPLITQGPQTKGVERELEALTGAGNAVLCSSGTAALHVACAAAGIGSGDEVITTPFTFAATANSVLYLGGRPVFADIRPDTYNIDPEQVRKKITPATRAVIAVDYAGQPADLDELSALCKSHGLVLIEDAAHSIGSLYKGRSVGSLADLTTFSFHPVKTVTSGEGGAILTNDAVSAQACRQLCQHGIRREFPGRDVSPWYYEQVSLGYNYRITDFQAMLLHSQLQRLQQYKQRRQQIVEIYNEAFAPYPALICPYQAQACDVCWHLYVLRLVPERLRCDRRTFFAALSAENLQPQVHYIPVYWHPYYRSLGYTRGACPCAESAYETVLSLPLYPAMSDQDVQDTIRAVKKVTEYFSI